MKKSMTLKFNWYEHWLIGWTDILNGLIGVVTFGMITPMVSFKFVYWLTDRKMKNYQKQG